MKTGNLNGVDLTSDGAGTNYLADDGTYKAVSGGGSQDLKSVIDQDPISTSYPIFKGDSLTGENLLTRYADNNEDSALDVKYDNTNNVFVFRIGDINARDIEVRNFNDKILTLATSAATDSFTAHKIATFEDDVVVENTSDNGITQLIGLDASNVVRQANVISHDIQQLNQPTAWVNGGFQSYYGTGSNPSGNIGVGLVQTANKAQLVAGAFGTTTSNFLEIQAAASDGVEVPAAEIRHDKSVFFGDLETDGALDVAQGANFGGTIYVERQNDTIYRYGQVFQRGDNSGGAGVIYTEGDGSNGVAKFGISTLRDDEKMLEFDLSTLDAKIFYNLDLDGYFRQPVTGQTLFSGFSRDSALGSAFYVNNSGGGDIQSWSNTNVAYGQGVVARILNDGSFTSQGGLNLPNLPTSSAGLSAGDVWNDGGTLKIV